MKNGILVLMLQFILYQFMNGQTIPEDFQWVIKGENGVLRTTTSSSYSPLGNSGNKILFNNFRYPQSGVSGARNDIFIIYGDGSFYNSYGFPAVPWNGSDGMNYVINYPTSQEIKYLYWTNRYEGDDLENAQIIRSDDAGSGILIPDNQIKAIDVQYFNTNHDIVPKKDVTVIIGGLNKNCSYRLTYNDCGTIDCVGLLTSSFEDMSVNLRTPSAGSVNEVTLDVNNKNNAFVNFYVNEITNIDSLINSGAKMKFSIIGTGGERCLNTPLPIEIPIRAAYDPNFIKLDSVCVQPSVSGKNDYFLNYYAQVQNTGNDVAPNVHIQIPIQEEWDVNDLHLTGLIYNGTRLDINDPNVSSEITENNLLKVSFPKNRPLYAYNKDNKTQSIAAFEFRVKVKNSHVKTLISYPDLCPQDSKSNFDGTYYEISTFVNLFSEKSAKNCFKTGGKKIEKSISQVINSNTIINLPQAADKQKCCTCKSCCKKKCKKRRKCRY